MNVILMRDWRSLGAVGSVVRVKDGYAKNYLVPNGIAVYATKTNIIKLEAKKDSLVSENAKRTALAELIASSIDGAEISITRITTDSGRLYGAVTTKNIYDLVVDLLIRRAIDHSIITPSSLHLAAAIKSVGTYVVKINLSGKIEVSLSLVVVGAAVSSNS